MQFAPAMEICSEALSDEAWFGRVASEFKASRVPISGASGPRGLIP